MADIKISEIANKASISDLSNSRYIVSVPSTDNTTFSTKYAVGADILSFGNGGGFIDTLTPVSHNGPTLANGGAVQFPNFNPSTQVIFFLSNGGGIVPEAASSSTAHDWSTNITIRRNSTGLVQVQSNNSNSNGASVPVFRFSKVGAGGGLSVGSGGFIDTLTPVSNNGPTLANGGAVLFPNFDEDTQVIFFFGNDHEQAAGIVPLQPSGISGGSGVSLKRSTTQPGLVEARAGNSGNNGKSCPVFRFSKVGSNIVSSSVNEQAGTTYTLQASDFGKILKFTSSNAITLTVPHNLVIGFNCTVIQNGSGQITFSDNGSSTLYNRQSHTKTAGQYAVVKLTSCVADKFILSGDTAA